MLGVSENDSDGIVEVLSERLWIFTQLAAMLDSIRYIGGMCNMLGTTIVVMHRVLNGRERGGYAWIHMARRLVSSILLTYVHSMSALYLQGIRLDIQWMGAQPTGGIRLGG